MRPRVLVVDDDPDIRASLHMVLDDYEVVGARDGVEGLAFVEAGGIDVVVLDLMMPTMDGVTFLREMRARGIDLPVIVSSAATGLGERVRALGVPWYLPKPFDIDQLEDLLVSALSRPRTNV